MNNSKSVGRFAASFQQFLQVMEENAPKKDKSAAPPLLSRTISKFIGGPVHELAVARSSLLLLDLPNIQLACEELFVSAGWSAQLSGYTVEHDNDFGMATVLMPRDWDPVLVG